MNKIDEETLFHEIGMVMATATGGIVKDVDFWVKAQQRVMDKFKQALQQQEEKEICICAAVVSKNGKITRGHRHGDCMMRMQMIGLKFSEDIDSQGFITSKNRYVNRTEGKKLQDKAGIKSADPEGYRPNTLFSEDLY